MFPIWNSVQANLEASQLPERALTDSFGQASSTQKKLYAGRFTGETVFWEKYASLNLHEAEVENSFEGKVLYCEKFLLANV